MSCGVLSAVLLPCPKRWQPAFLESGINIGALIVRIGFWGPLYYTYNNKEPTAIVLVYYGERLRILVSGTLSGRILLIRTPK